MENGMGDIIASLVRNNGENNMGCNGGGIWIILLFFLLCGGGYGWGGNRAGYATQQDVSMGFANQNLENAVRGNGAAINQLGVQSMGQAANLTQAVNHAEDATMAAFANTNNNICSLKYEMAQNATAITTNATQNMQAILNKLSDMEQTAMQNTISQLRQDLQAAQLTLANANQTQNIVAALRTPNPVPAYVVNPPCPALTAGTTIV